MATTNITAAILKPGDMELTPWPLKHVLEGKPEASYCVIGRSEDGRSYSGVWECTPGKFRVNYEWEETIYGAANSRPSLAWLPKSSSPPLKGRTAPSFIGVFCAMAGMARGATEATRPPAAMDFNSLRRVIRFIETNSLMISFWFARIMHRLAQRPMRISIPREISTAPSSGKNCAACGAGLPFDIEARPVAQILHGKFP